MQHIMEGSCITGLIIVKRHSGTSAVPTAAVTSYFTNLVTLRSYLTYLDRLTLVSKYYEP